VPSATTQKAGGGDNLKLTRVLKIVDATEGRVEEQIIENFLEL
jgi:hypothetical protein